MSFPNGNHKFSLNYTNLKGTSNNRGFRRHWRSAGVKCARQCADGAVSAPIFWVPVKLSVVQTDLGRQNASILASFR